MEFPVRHHFWQSRRSRWASPATPLEGQSPSLWLRADQGVYTGGSRQFYSADKTEMLIADNAALSANASSITLATWIYIDSGATYGIASKTGEWDLYVNSAQLRFIVYGTGSSVEVATSVPSASGWHFIIATIDVSGDLKPTLYVDNGAAVQGSAISGTTKDLAGDFHIGMLSNFYFNGRLSKMAFWKRTLTTAERTWLYNIGNGRSYGELGVAATDGSALLTSLSAYWNMNEVSGTSNAIDAHSTNDLTPTFAEITVNGDFETWASSSDASSWTEFSGGTGTVTQETSIVHGGSNSAKLTADAGNTRIEMRQVILTQGHRYQVSCWARDDGSHSGTAILFIGGGGGQTLSLSTTSTFQQMSGTKTADGGTLYVGFQQGANSVIYYDDVSVKALDIPAANGPESEIAADSVGSNPGVLTNFANPQTAWSSDKPTPITSLVNGSLAFDGVDDYVNIGSLSNGTSHTMSFWMNYTDSGDGTIFGGGSNIYAGYISGPSALGTIGYHIGGSPVTAVHGGFTSGTWYHIAIVRSGTSVSFYKNGTQIGTTQTLGANTAQTLTAIGRESSGGFYFQGSLSDVRRYAEALSLSQVAELYAGSEATGATPTSRWKLDDGPQSGIADGDPIVEWRSIEGSNYQFQQATASKRPLYVASAINSKPGIDFDGTDDLLVKSSAFLTGTSGTVIIVYRLDAVPNAFQIALATADEAVGTRYVMFAPRGDTANAHINMFQRNADTEDSLDGSTTVNVDTNYVAVFASNGTTTTARLNGTAQTLNADGGANNGDWFDDTTAKDNVTLGALKYNAGEALFLNGKLCEILVYPINLSAASIAQISAYMTTRYSLSA